MSKLMLAPVLLFPIVGCVAGSDDPPGDPPDTTYTRTIVRVADDGSETVSMEPITATEQRLEHEAAVSDVAAIRAGVKQRTLAVDSCADWYATKFFDGTGYTGNELCLIGTGYGRLGAYCSFRFRGVCLRTWSGSVRSFWTGQSALSLGPDYGTEGCRSGLIQTFPPYEAVTTLDACLLVATEFWIFTPS